MDLKSKTKDYIKNVKEGFVPNDGLKGFKGLKSRIINLWGHSIQGKGTIILICLGIISSFVPDEEPSMSQSENNRITKVADVEEERSLGALGVDEIALTKCDSCIDGSKLDLRKVPEIGHIIYEATAKGESWGSKKPYSGPVCFYHTSSETTYIRRLQGTVKDGIAVGKWSEWGEGGVKLKEMNAKWFGGGSEWEGSRGAATFKIFSNVSERVGKWTYWTDHFQKPKGMKTKEEIYSMDGKDVICEITEYNRGGKAAEYTEINSKQIGKYVGWSGGQKISEGIYERGRFDSGIDREGKWTFWGGSGGKDTYEIIYKNDREWDGTKVVWIKDRRYKEITYKEQYPVKEIEYYTDNDNLKKKREKLLDGGQTIFHREWFENGQQKITRTKDGDTIILTYWYENGKKEHEVITTDDKYNEYRALSIRGSYKPGRVSNGKISGFTKDGTLQNVSIFENGKIIDKISY